MKILRFDLLAYGCFTGSALDLSGGQQGLHVIYGANEAGKSTALRALTCLLYGFPHSTADAHVHQATDLRVGALLQAADGRLLECVRRKGKKDTLRSADETRVIEPRELATMLGGIDEESFTRRFGISHTELEAGGKLIVDGQGDLGQTLFAAAAGVADLARVRQRLCAEAETWFKPRGQNPRINKALREYAEQRKRVKECQVPVAEFMSRSAAGDEAQKKLAAIERDLLQLEQEKRRLERFQQALPEIGLRCDLEAKLAPLATAPRLAATFDERQRAARDRHDKADVMRALAQGEIERLAAEIAKLGPAQGLLPRRKEIEQLKKELGSVEKAQTDRPGLAATRRKLEHECQDLWQRLDPTLASKSAGARLTVAERARLNTLVAEHPRLAAALDSASANFALLTSEIHRLEEKLGSTAVPQEARTLRRALREAELLGAAERETADARRNLARLEQQIQQGLAQLHDWRGTTEELSRRPLPTRETIEHFRTQLDAAVASVKQERSALARSERELADCAGQLEQLRLQQDAPTEADVAAARRQRDEGFQILLAALKKELVSRAAETAFINAFPPAGNLSQAYELAVRRADDLADRLWREAAHVERKCALQAEHARVSEEVQRERARTQEVNAEALAVQAEWERAWSEVPLPPRSPAEMRAWRDRASELEALAQKHQEQLTALHEREAQLAQALAALRRGLAEAGAMVDEDSSLVTLCQQAHELLEKCDGQSRVRESLTRELAQQRDKLPALRAHKEQAEAALAQWRGNWAEAIKPLDLAPRATPAEAGAVLTLADEIQAKMRENDGIAERIAGIDRDADVFAKRVQSLVTGMAADLAELPAAEAAEALAQRVQAESNAAARREELEKARQLAETKFRGAEESRVLAAKELEGLCREAECQAAEELPHVAARARARAVLETALDETMGRLRRCAAGETLEVFLAHAAATNEDALHAQLQAVNTRLSELALARDTTRDRLRDAESELAKIAGAAGAAEAQATAERLAAEVTAGVEEYARLHLAAAVLAQAVERYRQKNQGELLERASDLFQELTLGSFVGLRADCNEAGEPILVGVRRGNRTLGVREMSHGARDQLYLALRLASVETHCKTPGVEPLPFVVDDVLIQFDDDRSAAALRALARLAEHTQVVFFTHHEHLLELAQNTLDDDVLFIQRLPGQGSATPLTAGAERVAE